MTPATQYYFRVRAKSAIGDGPWSAVKSLTAPQGIRVRLDGARVPKPLYAWMDGVWVVPTSIKGRSGGAWVEASQGGAMAVQKRPTPDSADWIQLSTGGS